MSISVQRSESRRSGCVFRLDGNMIFIVKAKLTARWGRKATGLEKDGRVALMSQRSQVIPEEGAARLFLWKQGYDVFHQEK